MPLPFRLKPFLLLALLFAALFSGGCAQNYAKMQVMNKAGQHQEVIEYFEANQGPDFTWVMPLREVNQAYFETKNYRKFIETYSLLEKKLPPFLEQQWGGKAFAKAVFLSRILNMRSMVDSDLGDYPGALRRAEESIALCEPFVADSWFTGYHHMSLLKAHCAAGTACALMGRRTEAEEHLSRMEELMGSLAGDPDTQQLRRINIAKVHMALGSYRQALETMDRIEWLGVIDRVGEALQSFGLSELLRITKWDEKKKRALLLNKDFMLTKALFETGDLERATKGYDDLLLEPLIRDQGGLYFVALHDRGRIALLDGEWEEALRMFREAVSVIESQRGTITAEAGKIGFVGDKQAVYRDLVATLVDRGRFSEAFGYAERSKARALVDLLASKKSFSGGSEGDQARIVALLDEQELSEQEAATRIYRKADPSRTRGISAHLKKTIAEISPELSSLVTVSPPEVEEIRSLIPTDETLVEFYGGGDDLYAFLVTRGEVRAVKLDGKGLAESVAEFRRWLKNPQAAARGMTLRKAANAEPGSQAGPTLYQRLFAPLADMIETKNVTIVPHGPLHYLPFAALSSGEDYLLDRYNLRMLPSASVMQFLGEDRVDKAGSALVFGNPDLGQAELDLPFAQTEAQTIGKIMAGSRVLVRDRATETAAKSFGSGFRYLHFASHGVFDPEKPLASGLMLAKDDENDGMLTVSELYESKLDADLVTLSACETALGKVTSGDDVVGFTRGFLYAGANSILSSLWQVDDEATGELMKAFYLNLKEMGKREALRLAQLSLRDGNYGHPYYWAAFQLTGAAR